MSVLRTWFITVRYVRLPVMGLPHLHGFNFKSIINSGLHHMGMNESKWKGVTTVSGQGNQTCRVVHCMFSWPDYYEYNSSRSEEALAIAVQPGLTVSTPDCLVVM